MRNLFRTSLILGTMMSASGALALVAVGCSGDDTAVEQPDGGGPSPDASQDVSTDHSVVARDARADTESTDAKEHSDAKPGSDAEPDVAPGVDSATDAAPDAAPGVDAQVADAGPDADAESAVDAPTLAQFPNAVNTIYCKRLATCCDGADAAAFQLGECVSGLSEGGAPGWLNVSLANPNSGNIVYSPTNAASCLADIGAIDCATVTAAAIQTQISTCGQAMVGTLPIGTRGCTSAWDCAPPAYCDTFADSGTTDGGTGVCARLQTVGTACQDINFSTDCSELGNGHPANYCEQDGGECQPEFPNGTACQIAFQCQSQICESTTMECLSSEVFSDPGVPLPNGTCAFYNTPPSDAGP